MYIEKKDRGPDQARAEVYTNMRFNTFNGMSHTACMHFLNTILYAGDSLVFFETPSGTSLQTI